MTRPNPTRLGGDAEHRPPFDRSRGLLAPSSFLEVSDEHGVGNRGEHRARLDRLRS